MIQEPRQADQPQNQPSVVRFSEAFIFERNRRERRLRLLGAVLALMTGGSMVLESVQAFRANVWVDVAQNFNHHVNVPAALGILVGLVIALTGLYFLTILFVRSK